MQLCSGILNNLSIYRLYTGIGLFLWTNSPEFDLSSLASISQNRILSSDYRASQTRSNSDFSWGIDTKSYQCFDALVKVLATVKILGDICLILKRGYKLRTCGQMIEKKQARLEDLLLELTRSMYLAEANTCQYAYMHKMSEAEEHLNLYR
jgi:hypothetical protein